MKIGLDLSGFHNSRWYEYVIRFVFGGAITVIAGVIAKYYGPVMGGLFLAFPAIFPASATLVEKHEIERKHKYGMHGTRRGRQSAGLDADGAKLGSIGLLMFAVVVWAMPADLQFWIVLIIAIIAWAVVSGGLWYLRKAKFFLRPHHHASQVRQ